MNVAAAAMLMVTAALTNSAIQQLFGQADSKLKACQQRSQQHNTTHALLYIEIRFSCAYWLLSVICLLGSHLSKCCVSHRQQIYKGLRGSV